MYELSRVRLYSVGPSAARYQDVTLDLREVGEVVAKPNKSATLFDITSWVLRRPSPASVLFAENGNGKTVLVKLIFSVMLPGRRQVVGTSNTKALDNFVLANDVAHVALEWMHVDTGELVVTGKVSAWRDHRVSSDPNRLSEAWYAFRPTDGFTLDDLPFTENDRLVGLPGFRDRLTEASGTYPHLELAWETQHRDWTEKLDNLDLDPELFAYQRRMNAGEGEAANAFSFKSDEGFVDWLLTSVMDKEGPRAMAEVVNAYAARLAERDGVLAERDFVDGALQRLGPLATAARDYAAAQDIQAEAARDATRLAIALDLRHRAEDAKLTRLVDEQAAIGEQVDGAERKQRRLNRIVLELQRLVAEMRLHAAEQEAKRLDDDRTKARAVVEAWQATDVLLRFNHRRELANAVREAIRRQKRKAEGPLAARDAAARRLVHGLIHAAVTADEAASDAEAEANALTEKITTAAGEETEHHVLAERHRAAAKGAQEKVNAINDRIEQARSDGLLAVGEDLLAAAHTAEESAHAAEDAVSAADAQTNRLRGERRAAQALLRTREAEASAARRTATDAAQAHDAAKAAASALTAVPRLAALLGVDEILLDADADALVERLATAVDEGAAEHDQLRDLDRADKRVLDALGVGGLLPPPAEVTTVRDTLRDAGITCYTGWEYLAQMPEDERETVLRLYPHLIDGVALNNPAQADEAEALLKKARLLPSAVVAVGATTTFEDLTGHPPTGLRFLVQPNPALYDEDLAEAERKRLEATRAERLARLGEVNTQLQQDQRLSAQLAQWRETYPPGTLETLAETRAGTEAAATQAEEAVAQVQEALDAIADAEEALAKSIPGLRGVAKDAAERARRLGDLATEHALLPGWTNDVRTNREDAARAGQTARDAHATAERLRRQQANKIRLRDDHKRTAQAHRREITNTPGAAEVDTTATPPDEAIETLRSGYYAAVAAYEKVEVGADLRADLDAKEQAESESHAAVESLPSSPRTKAAELLASPDGGDAPARAAATERAQRDLSDMDRAIRESDVAVGTLKKTYEQIQPQETTLDPYGDPISIPQGEELIARATADWNAATSHTIEVKARAASLKTAVDTTKQDVAAFNNLVDSLDDSLPAEPADPDSYAAYAGSIADARARRDTVRAALRDANDFLEQATTGIRSTAQSLNRYATDDRFTAVDSTVRRQILSVDLDRLHEYSPDWEEALKPRLRSLQDELAQIDRHRTQIVISLRGFVDNALHTLRSADRVSQLPEALDEWAGQHFLQIRFKDPDPSTLNEHLAAVIDNVANPDKASGKRDGMSIVLRGVRAALPHGVKVHMLKPDATLRTERVRISEVSDVFSGGQELTAAIILYCTMAALRANDRGRVRRKHAGVLFLDNPIGRASAGYLLELQLGVAKALGVQLVYTTGLFDINALSVFPLIIRLRNDKDARLGRKYLSVDDEIRQHLTALGEPDGTGRITPTRLFRRPGEPSASSSTGAEA